MMSHLITYWMLAKSPVEFWHTVSFPHLLFRLLWYRTSDCVCWAGFTGFHHCCLQTGCTLSWQTLVRSQCGWVRLGLNTPQWSLSEYDSFGCSEEACWLSLCLTAIFSWFGLLTACQVQSAASPYSMAAPMNVCCFFWNYHQHGSFPNHASAADTWARWLMDIGP